MKKNLLLFLTGGTLYPALEILCRGRTDFSMALAGGACLCLIQRVCNEKLCGSPLVLRCFAGSAVITSVEFCVGAVVNLALKMDVWDYSEMPANLLGQVCAPFSLLWFVLTIPAVRLCTACGKLADRL
jgi:uncharacterized membrane protein